MSAKFESIRKKRTVFATVNTAVVAISCFAIFYGAFMLISKLFNVSIDIAVQLGISGGAALLAGGITALFSFKSRRAIAKELDEDNLMQERIQTMLAYEGDESYVAQLQRADTEKQLARAVGNRSFLEQFGASVIALILAVSIMIPAILVSPFAADDGINDDPPVYVEPFELASWQSKRLEDLIKTVRGANIDENFKTTTVNELTRLLNVLEATDTKDGMIAEVISSIVIVDTAAELTASYKIIAVALFSAEPVKDEATAEIKDPLTYKQIKNLAKYLIKLNAIDFGQDIKLIREYFKEDSIITDDTATGSQGAEETVITVRDKIVNFKHELEKVLSDESIPESDIIKAHLLAFAAKLGEYAENNNESERQSLLDAEFDKLSDNISTQLTAQYENKAIRDNVINTLMLLFGIEKSMLPDLLGDTVPTLTDGGDDAGGSDESGSVSGGYGEGNELFGSNDTIYDPFGKDGAGHTLYGEVLDDYYKKIVELLSDESLSEETRQIIAEYFKKLSDGSKK